jgi:hypothetical protein
VTRARQALWIVLAVTPLALAQEPEQKKPATTSEALLALPAPAKDWREAVRVSAPGEEASAEELLRYWTSDWPWKESSPGEEGFSGWKDVALKTRERLLWACEQQPASLHEIVHAFDGVGGASSRVKLIYERVIAGKIELPKWLAKEWRRTVKGWLYEHGELREELIRALSKMDSEERGAELEWALEALVKQD